MGFNAVGGMATVRSSTGEQAVFTESSTRAEEGAPGLSDQPIQMWVQGARDKA